LVVLTVLGISARAGEPIKAQDAFDRLKTLAGEWKAETHGHGPDAPPGTISYKVTGGGKVIQETLFPGSDHEMVTMYFVDGDALRLTHYCAAGNQPNLKLEPEKSSADTLVFVFDGGTNLDPNKDIYIAAGRVTFQDGGKVVEWVWDANKGKEKFHSETFKMRRP
jgi:hypothetical protein